MNAQEKARLHFRNLAFEEIEGWHLALRNGRSSSMIQAAIATLAAYHAIGLLTDKEQELWKNNLKHCPGHNDGPRDWCAYCGHCDDYHKWFVVGPKGTERNLDDIMNETLNKTTSDQP